MWAKPLAVANAMSFHDDKRCKTFTEIIVTGPTPYASSARGFMCTMARSSASTAS